jgi:glyoxylase-like metal-dependent hydrolase (beta-lactamase superfamily II)
LFTSDKDKHMMDRLIEIKQDIPGFNSFFGSWICRGDLNLIVDVGPANSADRLIRSLSRLQLPRVDYILITHIHLDHAGALARILEEYPMARAICHADAIRHLINPERLWISSLNVLGDVASAYGPPKPVPGEKLIPHTGVKLKELQVIETPGHAVHHLSYSYQERLYAGEAAGNYLDLDGLDYLRPATPPKFFLDIFLKSLDALSTVKDQPIRYAHFGKARSSHAMLSRFRDQLLHWKKIIGQCVRQGGSDDTIIRNAMDLLLENDPNLAAFRRMNSDMQNRERMFMTNSIKGFIGFLNAKH